MDFMTLCPLIRRIRLNIGFLFVRLRFCYPFLSPTPHDVNLGSRFGVRRQLRPPVDFHHRPTACPSYPKNPRGSLPAPRGFICLFLLPLSYSCLVSSEVMTKDPSFHSILTPPTYAHPSDKVRRVYGSAGTLCQVYTCLREKSHISTTYHL